MDAPEITRTLDTTRLASGWAGTGVPLTPPGPKEPEPEDQDEDTPGDAPPIPPTEPPPVPIQDPPAEPGGNRPQIVLGVAR